MRTVLFASAALACIFGVPMALASKAAADSVPRCEATNLRVYFSHGSTTLDQFARQTLTAAQRNMTDCDYATVQVSVDSASSLSEARGRAVLAALNGRDWEETRVSPRSFTQPVSLNSSPEYVQVAMSTEPLAAQDQQAPFNPAIGM